MPLCIIYSTIAVWNANSNNYTITVVGIRWSGIHKISYFLFLYFITPASVNSVVVTVLYVLRALHRRIIVYRILSKIQRIRASLATAIYDNKRSNWTVYYLGRRG